MRVSYEKAQMLTYQMQGKGTLTSGSCSLSVSFI